MGLQRAPLWFAGTALFGGIVLQVAYATVPQVKAQESATAAESANTAPSFEPIIATIRHPRCMNCHTITDYPRQNDDRVRHIFGVVRGTENHGAAGFSCATCHSDRNDNLGGVPGAPHWGLAPLSMAWEYMTDQDICRQLKDTSRNGGRSIAELHQHMTEDKLVLWAWSPGRHPDGSPRSTPPYDLTEFRLAMDRWIEAGAPCSEGDTK